METEKTVSKESSVYVIVYIMISAIYSKVVFFQNLSLDIYDLCSILLSVGFVLTDDADSQKPKTTGRSIEIVCNVSI